VGPFCHSLYNRFGGPNLGATVGVKTKKVEPQEVVGQIKSRGLVLGATARIAQGCFVWVVKV